MGGGFHFVKNKLAFSGRLTQKTNRDANDLQTNFYQLIKRSKRRYDYKQLKTLFLHLFHCFSEHLWASEWLDWSPFSKKVLDSMPRWDGPFHVEFTSGALVSSHSSKTLVS